MRHEQGEACSNSGELCRSSLDMYVKHGLTERDYPSVNLILLFSNIRFYVNPWASPRAAPERVMLLIKVEIIQRYLVLWLLRNLEIVGAWERMPIVTMKDLEMKLAPQFIQAWNLNVKSRRMRVGELPCMGGCPPIRRYWFGRRKLWTFQ